MFHRMCMQLSCKVEQFSFVKFSFNDSLTTLTKMYQLSPNCLKSMLLFQHIHLSYRSLQGLNKFYHAYSSLTLAFQILLHCYLQNRAWTVLCPFLLYIYQQTAMDTRTLKVSYKDNLSPSIKAAKQIGFTISIYWILSLCS